MSKVIGRWALRLVVLVGLAGPLLAAPAVARSQGDPARDAAWAEDLDVLVTVLTEQHLYPFGLVTEEAFNQAAAGLAEDIPNLTDDEITVRLMQLTAMLGDSHTALLATQASEIYFPADFGLFPDGVVLLSTAEDYAEALGLRLVAIDDMPIADVLDRLRTVISHENNQWFRVQARNLLINPGILSGLGILATPESARYTFEDAAGAPVEVTFPALPVAKISLLRLVGAVGTEGPFPLSWERRNPFDYWYEWLPDDGAVYIQYNRCTSAASWPFDEFMAEVLAVIDAQPGVRVIVDLRNNTGGNSRILEPLIEALAARPSVNQPGKLVVLIGARTFSSAVLNAITFRQQTQAQLVGEPTGGKPNHFGETRTATLPNSEFVVSYSTKYFSWVDDDSAPSLMPDRVVETTSADYLARRDPVLEAALDAP